MESKKNILAGNNKFNFFYLIFLFYFIFKITHLLKIILEGTFYRLKILDKISSKNTLLKIEKWRAN